MFGELLRGLLAGDYEAGGTVIHEIHSVKYDALGHVAHDGIIFQLHPHIETTHACEVLADSLPQLQFLICLVQQDIHTL